MITWPSTRFQTHFTAFICTLPRLHLLPQQHPTAHHRHYQVPTLLTTTSQPGSATNLVDPRSHWPHQRPSLCWRCGHSNSPTMPLPQQQQCHNFDNANDNGGPMLSAPHHWLNATSAKRRERGGESGATWGSKIPTAALAMPISHALLQAPLQRQHPSVGQRDPYHCPCCVHPSLNFSMMMGGSFGILTPFVSSISTMGQYDIHMPPLPPH